VPFLIPFALPSVATHPRQGGAEYPPHPSGTAALWRSRRTTGRRLL